MGIDNFDFLGKVRNALGRKERRQRIDKIRELTFWDFEVKPSTLSEKSAKIW